MRKLNLPPLENLSDRHIAALERFIQKFYDGAIQHGDLVSGKDWTRDMLDETTDLAFYLIFQLMEVENEGERS